MNELIVPLENSPLLLSSLGALLGLIIGSFLNVIILRLPIMLERQWQAELNPTETEAETKRFDLAYPASHCPHCQHKIRPWENIPVISYLLLKGQCASCRQSISVRYPAVEILSAVLSAAVVYKFGFSIETLAALILTWALIALSVIDIDTHLLPDMITLPILWLGILVSTLFWPTSPIDAIWGACLGYLALWSVYHAYKLVTGKEGMGFGDFKLLGLLGAWLGWQQIPVIILLSSAAGAVIGISLILFKRHHKGEPLPFGPYLAIAGWLSLLWGDDILSVYLRFSGLE